MAKTIDELLNANQVEKLVETTDENGNIWRTVRFPSNATVSEMTFNKQEYELALEREKHKKEAQRAKNTQKEKDALLIKNSSLPDEIKEILLRRL